ncbi:hypothetical protein LR48_Vigan10g139100 [Vigna angularis]|uniref:Uncharacterized protein n=1 Tax=Phaseolus angularis TaxID=3914 RepID=A0A0L9VLA2_PHAAN|nr:hypothetical protein LR48_Vigan10g139100 [Vigna angularis]
MKENPLFKYKENWMDVFKYRGEFLRNENIKVKIFQNKVYVINDASAKPSLPTRAYDPYKDLDAPIRNLYHLPTSPEFLFVEEARRKRRSWGENLTFYTRCGYLAGAIGGAGSGLVEGVKAFESGDTMKLRINRVLNAAGHSGRVWGNRVGILGLLYAEIESRIQAARDADDV